MGTKLALRNNKLLNSKRFKHQLKSIQNKRKRFNIF